MPKKINAKCHGPIAIHRWAEVPWEDVWLSWKVKPGRKSYKRIGPVLISHADLRRNLSFLEKLQQESDFDFGGEIQKIKDALDNLTTNSIFIDLEGETTNCPIVYTSRETINKREAERMICTLMGCYGEFNIRIKWHRPKLVIIPC